MRKGSLRSVAMFARPNMRLFMLDVVRELKRRHGSIVHLYCNGPEAVRFYEDLNKEGLFETISDSTQMLMSVFAQRLDATDVFARASAMERRLGYGYNRLVMSNRHFGRGFVLGGFYHPRSRYSEDTDYVQVVHSYNETLYFWDRELAEKKITCALNLGHEAAAVCAMRGIPYRARISARFKNYHYWGHNTYYENPQFESAYRAVAGIDQGEISVPHYFYQLTHDRFLREIGLIAAGRKMAEMFARYCYWRIRGYRKGQGYYLRDDLRFMWKIRADYLKLKNLTRPLSALDGKSFVYYPLHVEPEYSVQGMSPEYFSQLTLIATVARDLPAGVYLAVKEASSAIGRRPDNFYHQIGAFKNVVFLDTLELGLECAKHSQVVITITGTAGFEAAADGKPVITFGQHNIYNFLPHVWVIRSEGDVAGALSAALSPGFDGAAAKRAGRRFLSAVVNESFDMRSYDFTDVTKYDQAAVTDAVGALERSLADDKHLSAGAGSAA